MARKVETLFIDDLDGSEATEAVSFGLDGKAYEIDLSGDNAVKLRNALGLYVEAARTVGKSRSNGKVGRKAKAVKATEPQFSSNGNGSSDTPPLAMTTEARNAIREWARANGHSIGDRGRIPEAILTEYSAAH